MNTMIYKTSNPKKKQSQMFYKYLKKSDQTNFFSSTSKFSIFLSSMPNKTYVKTWEYVLHMFKNSRNKNTKENFKQTLKS